MAVAMGVDAVLGWPDGLFTRLGHPVTWLGRLIGALDARWNRTEDAPWKRRAAGIVTALIVIALSSGLALAVQTAMPQGWSRFVLLGILAWPFVALRSLHDHVGAVAHPLQSADLAAPRSRVSRKTPPTASSRRCSGACCSDCLGSSATRRRTRSIP